VTDLMQAARAWWFGDVPGDFPLNHGFVSREACYRHGGPSRLLDACEECQESEWLSRACGELLYVPHSCDAGTSDLAHRRCLAQGDEAWCNLWQDFSFAEGADRALGAPSVLLLEPPKGLEFLRFQGCDVSTLNFLRQFGVSCTYDVRGDAEDVDWRRYDLVFVVNGRTAYRGGKPPDGVPVVMYGHDCYKEAERYQALIDDWRPDHFWCPNMASWRAGFRFPERTRFWFRADGDGTFFSRPNLGPEGKEWDLLLVGYAKPAGCYAPRAELARAVHRDLSGEFRVRIETDPGAQLVNWPGPTEAPGICCLNAWSAHLGRARFAMFGETTYKPNWVPRKAYELLGSGAVPIMPYSEDFAALGVTPWVHFIPLSWVTEAPCMRGVLRDYEFHRAIAERAVAWHRNRLDKLMFDGFEELLLGALEGRYRRRVIE